MVKTRAICGGEVSAIRFRSGTRIPERPTRANMGIHTSFGALLVRAKERGASFQSTATIGRQSLAVPLKETSPYGRVASALSEPDWDTFAADGYSEDFFARMLGAETVTSFDFSAYQRATVVHDFNEPCRALPRDP